MVSHRRFITAINEGINVIAEEGGRIMSFDIGKFGIYLAGFFTC